MREILFRGKRVDNGEWVEGCYAEFVHGFDGYIKPGIQVIRCVPSVANRLTQTYETELVEVFPETVGQYTRLKDRNGNKIFEGDILKLTGSYEETDGSMHPYEEIHEIVWLNGCFHAHNKKSYPYWPLLFEVIDGLHDGETYEIVGNIHEEKEE